MLGSITYVFLFAAGVRLLAPVAHRRLGYTPVDPAEDPVRMVASVDELPFLSGTVTRPCMTEVYAGDDDSANGIYREKGTDCRRHERYITLRLPFSL